MDATQGGGKEGKPLKELISVSHRRRGWRVMRKLFHDDNDKRGKESVGRQEIIKENHYIYA